MVNLSDFKKGKIFGAPVVGANVTKTAIMFNVSRSTIPKVMITFKKEKKTSSAKYESG